MTKTLEQRLMDLIKPYVWAGDEVERGVKRIIARMLDAEKQLNELRKAKTDVRS